MAKHYRDWRHAQAVRMEACRLAAMVLSSRPDEALMPTGWSLAVFFESYIAHGADWTRKPFGPKKPKKLKVVGKDG